MDWKYLFTSYEGRINRAKFWAAIGVFFSALLFGSLVTGTSTRNLDPEIFQPELASNLTLLIQGLVVLFVGADIVILWLLRRLRRRALA